MASVFLPGANIPDATRDRVRNAAREMGYRPNAMASGLRRRTSDTIGLISDVVATTPFAGEMLHGAQDAAWKARKLIMVVNTEDDNLRVNPATGASEMLP